MIAAGAAAAAPRPRSRLADPGRFWIRHVPRGWPAPGGRWVDLAGARFGSPGPAAERLAALDGWELDDVVYLPPVPERLAAERDAAASRLLAAGTPVLVQLRPGDPAPAGPGRPAIVYDLADAIFDGDISALGKLPSWSAAVWPLIGGVTDDPALWERAAPFLAAAGVAVVQPLVLEVEPVERRQLAGLRPEADYERIFHGPPASERTFSAAASRCGFLPFTERPLPPPVANGPRGLAANRRVAGRLAVAGELWLRLGREEGVGQGLLAAARHLDRLPHPVAEMAREGNLALLSWLGDHGRALVEDVCTSGESALLTALLAEYLAGAPEETP